MITKMKKLTLLVYHREYEAFLKDIRDLGVVDVVERQQGVAEDTGLQDNLRLSARLTAVLKQFQTWNEKSKQPVAAGGNVARGYQILDEVEAIQNERNTLNTLLQSYDKDKKLLEPWGNFSPQRIRELHDAGFCVDFYSCPERNYDSAWEDLYHAVPINKLASKVYFVTVTKVGEEVDMDAEQIKLPKLSLSEIAEYGISIQLVSLIVSLGGIWFFTFYPKLSQYTVQEKQNDMKRLYIKGTLFLLLTFIVLGTGLILLGNPILILLKSKTFLLQKSYLFLLLLFSLFEQNQVIAQNMIFAKNKVAFFKANILSGIAVIIILYLMLRFTNLGILSLILSTGIVMSLYLNWRVPLDIIQSMNLSFYDYIKVIKEFWKENKKTIHV